MAEYYQNAPIVNQAPPVPTATSINMNISYPYSCLLYTSDAADE